MRLAASVASSWTRRRLLTALAALPLVREPLPAYAAGPAPSVEVIGEPEVCQAQVRKQDFAVVRYIGRMADGTVFDDRYTSRPLVFEVGNFYLPGVDDALAEMCVGTSVRFRWPRAPDLGPQYASRLPPGTPIEVEMQLLSIKYQLFGEKMRNASNDFFFAPARPRLVGRGGDQEGQPILDRGGGEVAHLKPDGCDGTALRRPLRIGRLRRDEGVAALDEIMEICQRAYAVADRPARRRAGQLLDFS